VRQAQQRPWEQIRLDAAQRRVAHRVAGANREPGWAHSAVTRAAKRLAAGT